LAVLEAGRLWLDGGAFFGAVPRPRWAGCFAPDADNRVALAMRLLLLRDAAAGRTVLVDTGAGDKLARAKAATPYPLLLAAEEPEGGLTALVERAGVLPDEITDVVLTHLHTDHAGGATVQVGQEGDAPKYAPVFANATYHVQRRAMKWAQHAPEFEQAAFCGQAYRTLAASGQLHLLDGPLELWPDFSLVLSEGHSVAMQLPIIDGGEDGKLLYGGDLIPTCAHVQLCWVSACDAYPLTTIEEKRLLCAQALEEDWLVMFAHDPHKVACRLREEDGNAVPGDPLLSL
jgi:glyoxylase-like metal-dependent hydrolase (beta-lactamase superfamily II)